jgi:hypothetical protein
LFPCKTRTACASFVSCSSLQVCECYDSSSNPANGTATWSGLGSSPRRLPDTSGVPE